MFESNQNYRTHFGSDNHSGVHPRILKSIEDLNWGHSPAYGSDDYTSLVVEKLKKHFKKTCDIHFVFNGTAANVLALSCFANSYHSILTANTSHIWSDECGAPEKLLGAKLIPIASPDGKIRASSLSEFMTRKGDQHSSQVIGVSITQPTEYGTVYSLEELSELRQFADRHGLYIHMDGSRLVNAATYLQIGLDRLTENVDVLSLGGTKNGLLFGEAVVIFNQNIVKDFKFRRKQFMQLPSKTKFIACQFDAWLNTNLWKEISQHSLSAAQNLRKLLTEIAEVKITQETQSNAVFAIFPRRIVHELKKHHFFYIWDENTFEARLMTSFDSRAEDIESFAKKVKELIATTRTE